MRNKNPDPVRSAARKKELADPNRKPMDYSAARSKGWNRPGGLRERLAEIGKKKPEDE